MMCGSGGDSTLTTLTDVEKDDSESRNDSSAFPSHNEIIAAIRSSLSLQIKELAEILRVQRPTVYSWIKNEVEPSPTNRERLQYLYRIARKWKQLCNLPADSLIRSTGADGHSVLELLKADEVDQTAIIKRLEGLATQRRKMKREADEKRPKADSLAQSLGLGPDDISDQQEFIDALTGRRSNPE
jgi:DNA-binding transcriptional regulator YiaG